MHFFTKGLNLKWSKEGGKKKKMPWCSRGSHLKLMINKLKKMSIMI